MTSFRNVRKRCKLSFAAPKKDKTALSQCPPDLAKPTLATIRGELSSVCKCSDGRIGRKQITLDRETMINIHLIGHN